MNAKLSPATSAAVIVLVLGIIFAVMWFASNQRGPHLPIGMGQAMQQSGAGANRGPTGGLAGGKDSRPDKKPAGRARSSAERDSGPATKGGE